MKIYKEKIESLEPYTKLNDEDKKNLFCYRIYHDDFIKKDNIIYHKKRTSIERTLNEIIGEMISDYFNLYTVHSKMFINQFDKYYLLTELFTDKNSKFGYLNKDLFPNYSFIGNLKNLDKLNLIYDKEYKTKYNVKKNCLDDIKLSLKKLIIRDYITMLSDRWSANIMFQYNKSNIELMPIFDYEFSFKEGSMNPYNNVLKINLNDSFDINYLRNDNDFQELLEKAMKLNMKYIFKRLKDEYFIKLSNVEKWDYNSVIRETKSNIKSYKLIRK